MEMLNDFGKFISISKKWQKVDSALYSLILNSMSF